MKINVKNITQLIQFVEEYFFSKIKFINILTFSLFSLIYRRIYIQNIILILHYSYIISLVFFIMFFTYSLCYFTLKSVKYHFNIKYSNNIIILY